MATPDYDTGKYCTNVWTVSTQPFRVGQTVLNCIGKGTYHDNTLLHNTLDLCLLSRLALPTF